MVDPPEVLSQTTHERTKDALERLRAAGFFKVDVTQPHGLGTKLAKTFVTRTLVGEAGTTYKYLGLRMFSHPWDQTEVSQLYPSSEDRNGVGSALSEIGSLNQEMRRTSTAQLQKLKAKNNDTDVGSCHYNLTLINFMEPQNDIPDLKFEPTFNRDKCSVSWHADSSLEHFSTIAVYHLTEPPKMGSPLAAPDWKIALRVAYDAEGPTSTKLKHKQTLDSDKKESETTPLVAVPLPSRSTYYLLDDFNHHHHHAVLAGHTRRFASTHRVCRSEGHTFEYISSRCAALIRDSNKRTLKQFRAEQLCLNEVEFEWIRQFYVQGGDHRSLHIWWHEPMKKLEKWWVQLEERTKYLLDVLLAPSSSVAHTVAHPAAIPKNEKKTREKKKKNLEFLTGLGREKGLELYALMEDVLKERNEKRMLWKERVKSKVFDRLPAGCRPLTCPLFRDTAAASPLSDDVQGYLQDVTACKHIFDGRFDSTNSTINSTDTTMLQKDGKGMVPRKNSNDTGHDTWAGRFGLEVQAPFAKLILDGEKEIETRRYQLPQALVGKWIDVLETPAGADGQSSLADRFICQGTDSRVRVVGMVKLGKCSLYKSQQQWDEEQAKHCVPTGSKYGWQKGQSHQQQQLYGWHVMDRKHKPPQSQQPNLKISRVYRSLFKIENETSKKSKSNKEVEKRKRQDEKVGVPGKKKKAKKGTKQVPEEIVS